MFNIKKILSNKILKYILLLFLFLTLRETFFYITNKSYESVVSEKKENILIAVKNINIIDQDKTIDQEIELLSRNNNVVGTKLFESFRSKEEIAEYYQQELFKDGWITLKYDEEKKNEYSYQKDDHKLIVSFLDGKYYNVVSYYITVSEYRPPPKYKGFLKTEEK